MNFARRLCCARDYGTCHAALPSSHHRGRHRRPNKWDKLSLLIRLCNSRERSRVQRQLPHFGCLIYYDYKLHCRRGACTAHIHTHTQPPIHSARLNVHLTRISSVGFYCLKIFRVASGSIVEMSKNFPHCYKKNELSKRTKRVKTGRRTAPKTGAASEQKKIEKITFC